MSRSVAVIAVVVLIVGVLVFVSTLPKQQPTHTIEVPVTQAGNGR